ncbi:hypothetical protein FKM82_000623 [Ascaphus truei]
MEVASAWPYFKNMQFLKEQMLPAKTVSNLEEPGSQEETILELSFVEDEAVPESVSAPDPVAKKPKTSNDLLWKMVLIEEQKCGLMDRMMKNNNDDLEFFKSFLPFITPLDKMFKLRFRK